MRKEKIGIFGGTFNPIHEGHMNSVRTVLNKLELNHLYLVPTFQNPLKAETDLPSVEDRKKMIELALQGEDERIEIDDQELRRGKTSYTVETLKHYSTKFSPDQLYLIIGADAFAEFDRWKNFDEILKLANLVVTTRPTASLPLSIREFPSGIQPLIEEFDYSGVAHLKLGGQIVFVSLKDIPISATTVRRRMKTGKSVDQALHIEVERYIKEKNLYPVMTKKIPDFKAFTEFCAAVLFDRKAINVRGYDLRKLISPTEFSLVASGTSARAAGALAEAVVRQVKEEFGVNPLSVEGTGEGRWVLVDYGSLILHIFFEPVRHDYRIEDLWKSGTPLQLKDPTLK